MWKFVIFAVIVQIVVLMSILDVYIYQDDHVSIHLCPESVNVRCPADVSIIVAEGADMRSLHRYWLSLLSSSNVCPHRHEVASYEVFGSLNESTKLKNDSIFDRDAPVYVGPPYINEYFNVTSWHLFFPYKPNETQLIDNDVFYGTNSSSQTANSEINYATLLRSISDDASLVHDISKSVVEDNNYSKHNLKLFVFPSIYDGFLPIEKEELYFDTLNSYVNDLVINSSKFCSGSFVVLSSLKLLIPNANIESNETIIVVSYHPSHRAENGSLKAEEAYYKLREIITGMSRVRIKISLLKQYLRQQLYLDGNVLKMIGDRQVIYRRDNHPSLFLFGYESINAIFYSLAHVKTLRDPIVVASTIATLAVWAILLAMKTVERIANPIKRHSETKYSNTKRIFTAATFVLLFVNWAAMSYHDAPFRYVLYWTVFIIICRLVAEEILNFKLDITLSLSDRIKISMQVVILLAVVEGLFWSILHKKLLFILFVTTVCTRILQGAFSVTNLKTVVVLAGAAFMLGIAFICPYPDLGLGVATCITAAAWVSCGLIALRYMIKNSDLDRMVLAACLFQLIIASILAITYSFLDHANGQYAVVYFLFFGASFPLFGGPYQKYRLLQLALCCGSVHVFFSGHGEGISFLAAFVACFNSFLMEKAAAKRQTEVAYYVNVFPILFFVTTLILVSQVSVPVWKLTLFPLNDVFADGTVLNILSTGALYLLKLAYLVVPLEAAFLTAGQKLLELPNLFAVVMTLNLVSLRAVIHQSSFVRSQQRDFYTTQVQLHMLAAMLFYLYPVVQVMCSTYFLRCLRRSQLST